MRMIVGRKESVWTTTSDGAAAVEAELRGMSLAYVRTEGRYAWSEGEMPVVTYRFTHDVHVGPLFDAFDRLRAAGVWLYGHYDDVMPFA
jgi:hypothetical protein